MATACIPQLIFALHPQMKTVARFDQAQASTDGGVVLLKALDEHLQLTDRLAACLPDRRDPDKVRHAVRDLLRQRVFGLACGYEDGSDAVRLADDPLHKLADGGFAGNDWLDFLEAERVEYAVGLASNPRLERRAGRLLGAAYGLSKVQRPY
ncbi:MAG: transposase [Nitrospira sp.]|nr:transposase [Nitrospira sp.]